MKFLPIIPESIFGTGVVGEAPHSHTPDSRDKLRGEIRISSNAAFFKELLAYQNTDFIPRLLFSIESMSRLSGKKVIQTY